MTTGIILAGGKNRRMGGKEKALLKFDGERLLDRTVRILRAVCDEVLIVTNTPSSFLDSGCPLAGDIYPDRGPLGGIHSGLLYAAHPQVFAVACDMPFLNENFISRIISLSKGYDIVVPLLGGRYQPLHAVYGKRCLPRITALLAADKLKITDFYRGHRLRTIAERDIAQYGEAQRMFANLNSPEDMRLLEREKQ